MQRIKSDPVSIETLSASYSFQTHSMQVSNPLSDIKIMKVLDDKK